VDDIAFFDEDGSPLLYVELSNEWLAVQVADAEVVQLDRKEAERLRDFLTERLTNASP
jgi:hypothetical protein